MVNAVEVQTPIVLGFLQGSDYGGFELEISRMSQDELATLLRLIEKYSRNLLLMVKAKVLSTVPVEQEVLDAAKSAGITVCDQHSNSTTDIVLMKAVHYNSDLQQIPLVMLAIRGLVNTINKQTS